MPPLSVVAGDALALLIADEIRQNGGWIGFEALHGAGAVPARPRLLQRRPSVGASPASGSDFRDRAGALGCSAARWRASSRRRFDATGTAELREFGAGSGAGWPRLLGALGDRIRRYTIVDLSGSCCASASARPAPRGCCSTSTSCTEPMRCPSA